ncbi:hypothetical protein BGZ82_003260 [Podila clonocystis]|nr:hypothetical protein BGZ82_003260 [Podila clonocystis]
MDWPPLDEQQDGGHKRGHSLSSSEEESMEVDEEEEDDTYDTAEEPEDDPEPAGAQKKRATTREPPYNPPRPPQIKIRLHFRAGKPKERTRKRNDLPDDEVVDYTFGEDGYSVLRAKIKARSAAAINYTLDRTPYIQPRHTGTSATLQELNSADCNARIAAAWLLEMRRQKRELVRLNQDDLEPEPILGVFSFLTEKEGHTKKGTATRRRAGKKKVEEHTKRIEADPLLSHLGLAEKNYLAIRQARRLSVDAAAPITVPENNPTFKQLGKMDRQKQLLDQGLPAETEYKMITVKIGGGEGLKVEFNIAELREALGIPGNIDLNGLRSKRNNRGGSYAAALDIGSDEDMSDQDHRESQESESEDSEGSEDDDGEDNE